MNTNNSFYKWGLLVLILCIGLMVGCSHTETDTSSTSVEEVTAEVSTDMTQVEMDSETDTDDAQNNDLSQQSEINTEDSNQETTESDEDSGIKEYVIKPYEWIGVRLDYSSTELAAIMGNGWNLGNTMEAYAPGRSSVYDCEQAWSQPITTKPMIENIKLLGFDSIRIPVAWSNMLSDDGTYTIDEAYLNRVEEIIQYALDSELYVVINIHWDGGWWEDFGSADEETRNQAMIKYERLWTQIADHYKDYSQYLIFESANEELGHMTKGIHTENENYELVTAINQRFVDVVRNSGGLNDSRYLLIAGYNTDIEMTTDDRYILPKDTVDNRLLISVHYYTPSTYCIADKEDNSWGYMDSWGTDADLAEMDRYFKKMKKFQDAGIGVIIGEYGVTKKYSLGIYIYKEGSEEYIASVLRLSEIYGYCPMLWDASQWYQRSSGTFYTSKIAKIFQK